MFETKLEAITPASSAAAASQSPDLLKGVVFGSLAQFQEQSYGPRGSGIEQFEQMNTRNRETVAKVFAAIQGFVLSGDHFSRRPFYHDYSIAEGEEKRTHDSGAGKMYTRANCEQGVSFKVQETHNCQAFRITVDGAVSAEHSSKTYLIKAADLPSLIAENMDKPGMPFDRAAYFKQHSDQEKQRLAEAPFKEVGDEYLKAVKGLDSMIRAERIEKERALFLRFTPDDLIRPASANAFKCASDIRLLARMAACTQILSDNFMAVVDDTRTNRTALLRGLVGELLKTAKTKGNLLQKGIGWYYLRKLDRFSAEELKTFFLAALKSSLNSHANRANLACKLMGLEPEQAKEKKAVEV